MEMEALSLVDRLKEVKQFLETKAGVKGLVDSGISQIPRIFIHPPRDHHLQNSSNCLTFQVPVIDLKNSLSNESSRKKIVDEIKRAAETTGLFQIINHGIPLTLMEELLKSIQRFHEQPQEIKNKWFSYDITRRVAFLSNVDMKESSPLGWRDTLLCKSLQDDQHKLLEEALLLPQVFRKEISQYAKHAIKVGELVMELISEALGLSSVDYLTSLGSLGSVSAACNYYPVCPEPDIALGAANHHDLSFLTLLLQDMSGGLQLRHQNQWLDVPAIQGALVANLGDLMQLVTNDKLKSTDHRVLATRGTVPRVSVAIFFNTNDMEKTYGPIEELVSENNPPVYRGATFREYVNYFSSKGLDANWILPHFKLES